MRFGAETFEKLPAVLWTGGVQNLRLNGLLTLIAMTYARLEKTITLTRCPEEMQENVGKFDRQRATAS